jgi:hypothetical protein
MNHNTMNSIAADVAAAKNIRDGVYSEPSIKGWLWCEFMCQGMLQASRCCLWGSFGLRVLGVVVGSQWRGGGWLNARFFVILFYAVEYDVVISFWKWTHVYFGSVYLILLLFDLQITYVTWICARSIIIVSATTTTTVCNPFVELISAVVSRKVPFICVVPVW